MKYEIEHCHVAEDDRECAALISMLTGLELAEVWGRLPARLRKAGGWYGRDFVQTFRALGYDCSPDFRTKFDPATPYPCLLRFRPTKRLLVLERQKKRAETGDPNAKVESWWNVLVYYDGLVYDPGLAEPWPMELWNAEHFTPTTMMQVWVGKL